MPACQRCGGENPEEARFCSLCGTPLSREPAAAERKIITAVFCDMVGFTARSDQTDPEDVRALLVPFHARLKREIERFGGTLDKFIGDGALAVFGAPAAHEDDPERAVRLALEIQRAIAELNEDAPDLSIAVRMGVNTGEAVVAFGGRGPQIGESVTGDVVNTASRLQTAAPPGGILVGEATYRATRNQFVYEELPPVKVKGKAEPIPVWRPVSARSRQGFEPERMGSTRFVGRRTETAVLRDVFHRTLSEASVHLVTVTGEPGVGKSRLLGELFRYIDGLPDLIAWRRGQCLPYGEGITFSALSQIVKVEAGILESDPPAVVGDKLDRAVDATVADAAEADWVRFRLGLLVGLGSADVGAAAREESFHAWRRYLEAMALDHPLVLVVEDLHWADPPLLEFLEHLLEWASAVPLLVICSGRPELYERRPGWGGGARNSTTIALEPLSAEETEDLVRTLLGGRPVTEQTRRELQERSGGNPLYAEEFVRVVADREDSEEGEIALPDTVQALIAARLDTLPPSRKALVHDAAVVGDVFWAGAVASMAGIDEPEARRELHEVVRKELIRASRTSTVKDQEEYSFWHVLVRDVAYGQIPRRARGAKHRAVAEWIREMSGDRANDHAELIAHHYDQARLLSIAAGGDRADRVDELAALAGRYMAIAADRLAGLDVERAGVEAGHALELLPEGDPLRARALLRLAISNGAAGRFSEAETAFHRAREAFVEASDPVGEGESMAYHARLLHPVGKPEEARRLLAQAIDLLERHDPSPALARAYSRQAGIDLISGAFEECLELAEKTLDLANRFDVPEEVVRALQFRGAARAELGRSGGLEDLREAVRRGQDLGLGEETAVAYENLAYQLWLREGPAAALKLWEEVVEFCSVRGLQTMAMWGRAGLQEVLVDLGDWDRVLDIGRAMIEWDEERGGSQVGTFARTHMANVLASRGRVAEAMDLQESALPAARTMGYADYLAPVLAVSATVAVARADLEGAAGLVREFVASVDRPTYRAHHLPELLRALVAAAPADSVAIVERLLPRAEEIRSERHEISLLIGMAGLAELKGELAVAGERYADAASSWGKYGSVPELAHALAGQARCLRLLHREAEAAAVSAMADSALAELGVPRLVGA